MILDLTSGVASSMSCHSRSVNASAAAELCCRSLCVVALCGWHCANRHIRSSDSLSGLISNATKNLIFCS